MAKTEYEGIAFSSVINQDGYQISVTERSESSLDAYKNLTGTLAVMADEGCIPFISYDNKARQPLTPEDIVPPAFIDDDTVAPSVVQAAKDLGGVEADPFADQYPPTVELVDYLKKAGEWKTGDVQEVLVDQYKLAEGKIAFYKEGNEYPIHTHYLNDVGVKVMAQCFGDNWDKGFPTVAVPTAIPGGAFIIAVKGGNVRTKGQGAGNVFRNLSGARRP